jgi:hypothetical protein
VQAELTSHVISSRQASTGSHVPHRSSLPLTSSPSPSFPDSDVVRDDFTKRKFRASLPVQFVPQGYWDFMDSPRMQKARQNSLASTVTDRSSFESRYQRSLSYETPGSSARTSMDSGYAKAQRAEVPLRATSDSIYAKTPQPDVPLRATSWTYQGEHVPPKPTTLLRPQRLTPHIPKLKNTPGEAFRKLPKELLIVIVDQLKTLHLEGGVGSGTCPTCMMRDLCNLSLTSRKWAAAARPKLYEIIHLVGQDSMAHIKKKFKMKAGSRLKLLRRTLRGNTMLAKHVRDLKVPDLDPSASRKEQENYLDVVASIVMSCPNLERLLGLYPSYNHEFSRLAHALSTRTRLVEQVWNIAASPYQRQYHLSDENSPSLYTLVKGPLNSEEAANFLSTHDSWSNLTTMVFHCSPGGVLDPPLLLRTLRKLPSLQDLAISAIPKVPSNLLSTLPPLKSLYLAQLPNLSLNDLSTFATCSSAGSLTSLSLIDINLSSLPALARLLSNMTSLKRFTIKQDLPPTLPIGTSIFLHPYLASNSLKYLSWDILVPNEEDHLGDATRILAKAIRANGFPALRTLKAPCDYDGLLQSLCRPAERITSSYESGAWKGSSPGTLMELIDERRKDSGVDVSADSGYGSSTMSGYEYTRSLRSARLAAQQRIEAARSKPKIQVTAEDWSDWQTGNIVTTARYELGAYIGMVGSKIHYSLDPDVEGSDELGVGVEDLLESGETKGEGNRRGLCDGRWNMVRAEAGKTAAGWEHRERVRWRPLEVGRLF